MQKANPKKKKKNPKRNIEKAKPIDIIRVANYLNFAVDIRTLAMVQNKTLEEVGDFVESRMILFEEVYDKRSGVWEFIEDTKKLTGYDVVAILDSLERKGK